MAIINKNGGHLPSIHNSDSNTSSSRGHQDCQNVLQDYVGFALVGHFTLLAMTLSHPTLLLGTLHCLRTVHISSWNSHFCAIFWRERSGGPDGRDRIQGGMYQPQFQAPPNWWLREEWHQSRRRPPRKIRSAYAYFVQDNFRRIGRILGSRMPRVILRGLGQAWRNISEQERKPYRVRNLEDKERYRTMKEKWAKTFQGRLPRMRRQPKPVDAPKRRRTPYIIYTQDMSPRVAAEFPRWPRVEIVEEIAFRWRKLSEEEKEVYSQRSAEDQQRYAVEMHEYRRMMFRQVAFNRCRNMEIRLSCIRQQQVITRMERAAAAKRQPAEPVQQALGKIDVISSDEMWFQAM